jgi:hypothetical protein
MYPLGMLKFELAKMGKYQLAVFQVAFDNLVFMCLKPSVEKDENCWKTTDGQLETNCPTWQYSQV